MSDAYVPTLGEYAEIIEWLVTNPNEEVPKHMRRVFDDAMERAGMRRFAQSMEDAVDAHHYAWDSWPDKPWR